MSPVQAETCNMDILFHKLNQEEREGIQAKHSCPKNGQDPKEKSPLVFSCYPGPLPNLRVLSTLPLEGQGPFSNLIKAWKSFPPGRCVTLLL